VKADLAMNRHETTQHVKTRRVCHPVILVVSLCAFSWPSPFAAAAPNVTYLYPAGAQRGATVAVTAGGTFDKWPVRVWVDRAGVSAEAAKDKGKFTITVADDAAPGTYWLRAYDDTGASGLRPFVVGTLPEVAEKEPNDDPGTAQPVDLPAAVVNGRLEKAGDVDCFAVKLRRGQTLVAAVEAHRTIRSPMDAVAQVVSPDGFVLEQVNDHAGLDPLIAFTAPKDGSYVVRVFAFPATPDSGIRFFGSDACVYRLTLTTGGYADHAWPPAVSRDEPKPVALVGWNIPAAARSIPVATAGAGRTILVGHPEVANPVPVAVEPHPCWEASDLLRRSQPPAAPFTVSGRLDEPRQAVRFAVAGKKGQPLTVRCESPSLGFELSPALTARDPAGKVLARAEQQRQPNTDVELTFSPPQDAAYTIEVRDLHHSAGPRHAYRLTVRPPQPDFTLGVAADRITCEPGKPAEVVVTVARRDGFAKEVALTVEGLPPEVTAAVVEAKGKPDPAKLTLRFTATAAYKPGPVRIVGTAAGDAGLKRVATAALPDFGTDTEDLWLSAGAAPSEPKKKK
jgi:hypothetical protein